MSATADDQRTAKRGEIAFQTDLANLQSPSSEIGCFNSRCGGCCADLPLASLALNLSLQATSWHFY